MRKSGGATALAASSFFLATYLLTICSCALCKGKKNTLSDREGEVYKQPSGWKIQGLDLKVKCELLAKSYQDSNLE